MLARGGVSTCEGGRPSGPKAAARSEEADPQAAARSEEAGQPLIPTFAIPSTKRFWAKTNITIIGNVASAVPAIR